MKKIKLYPAPYVEIRIHVSDEMERDFWRCADNAKVVPGEEEDGDAFTCTGCSWEDICICGNTGACELEGLEEQLGGVNGETDGKDR